MTGVFFIHRVQAAVNFYGWIWQQFDFLFFRESILLGSRIVSSAIILSTLLSLKQRFQPIIQSELGLKIFTAVVKTS